MRTGEHGGQTRPEKRHQSRAASSRSRPSRDALPDERDERRFGASLRRRTDAVAMPGLPPSSFLLRERNRSDEPRKMRAQAVASGLVAKRKQ
jgi:hypothetical protein